MANRLLLPNEVSLDTAFACLRELGPVAVLESTLAHAQLGRQSLVAGAPLVTLEYRSSTGFRLLPGRCAAAHLRTLLATEACPFGGVQRALQWLSQEVAEGVGAFGFFGYETRANPGQCSRDQAGANAPDAVFILTDLLFRWNQGEAPTLQCADPLLAEQLRSRCEWGVLPVSSVPQAHATNQDLFRSTDLSLERYERQFQRVRTHLRRGEAYQLCLTYDLERSFAGDPWHLYQCLRRHNPAPFAGYFEASDLTVVSSSPERFLRVDRSGRVEARPMKGTAAKGTGEEENRAIRQRLVESQKDRAENLMIADLLRNDLGRVCELGSVQVTHAADLEEYETVYQLVSRVEGQLDRAQTRADLLASAFPPGSMTGAPKKRSIQLLEDLEQRRRGPYSGVLGYWMADGCMDFSVLIRTWVLVGDRASCGVGGGIVWDSVARDEFEESRTKARALLQALAEHQATLAGMRRCRS
jgi:para-aminobenzoate synthetase